MSEYHWHCMSCDRDLGPMVGKHESKCPDCGCKSAYCAQEEPDCKRETCHDVCNSVAEFTCSACGFNCDLTSWISLFDGDDGRHRHHHHGTPNFCPNCGRKVVEPTTNDVDAEVGA